MVRPAVMPMNVLVKILQHIPLTERMSSCSLVQQSWRQAAAATATTTSIRLKGVTASGAGALANQLSTADSSWQQNMTSIRVVQQEGPDDHLGPVLPQLACPQLLQLRLSGFILTLRGDADTVAGAIAAAGSRGLVPSCPLLQELSLSSCWVQLKPAATLNAVDRSALSLLTELTALTRLRLGSDVYITARGVDQLIRPDMGPLSGLTALQDLSLVKPSKAQLQQLLSPPDQEQQQNTQLLPCLTKLAILKDGARFSPATTPGLYRLTSLRHLDVKGAEVVSVSQLVALTQLDTLVLHSVTSLKNVPNRHDGYDDIFEEADQHPRVADRASLLRLLPQLPRLTRLDVFGLGRPEQAAVPQWTCLGRCTGLQVLRLQNVVIHRDSWPLVFTGAQLGNLRELRLTSFDVSMRRDHHVPMPPECMQDMVEACPNLEVLQLGGDCLLSWQYKNRLDQLDDNPVSLFPLVQLQHLTSLRVYCLLTQAFAELHQLRQLRHLVVGGRATDVVLGAQLIDLTNLTSFKRLDGVVGDCESWDDSVNFLELTNSQELPVSQQILNHCQQSGWCDVFLPRILELQQQLQQQQQRLEAKDGLLAEQQQQLEAKDGLLVEKTAELDMLRAYIAGLP